MRYRPDASQNVRRVRQGACTHGASFMAAMHRLYSRSRPAELLPEAAWSGLVPLRLVACDSLRCSDKALHMAIVGVLLRGQGDADTCRRARAGQAQKAHAPIRVTRRHARH